jgi:hypothetical protein
LGAIFVISASAGLMWATGDFAFHDRLVHREDRQPLHDAWFRRVEVPPVERVRHAWVDICADDFMASCDEARRERQSDLAETNDRNLHRVLEVTRKPRHFLTTK